MLKNKEKWNEILVFVLIGLMGVVILFYQTKKVGFHEDEVYSIASSINPYDGVISPYGEKDNHTIMTEKYIKANSLFKEAKNFINYVKHYDDFEEEMTELFNKQKPIWKTKEDINNGMTLSKNNYMNLKAIYYNQAKDNHPPFFYFLVHLSSILFHGQFSKYTVFVVNIIAFILSCIIIKKVLNLTHKKNLILSTLLLYGLSMGTITMVIYQRMYMLLTFFILLYFYLNLKIYKNDFKLTLKLNLALGATTILGFLTQYFFAIYALFIFLLMIIKMLKDKKYKNAIKYFAFHILYAIIGILIFIPCIHHLLFSDRGISNLANSGYISHMCKYLKLLLYAFTIKDNLIIAIFIIIGFLVGSIYFFKKSNNKFFLLLTTIPSIFYFLIVVKLTSFQELRYVMPMLPFIVISFFILLDSIIKCKNKNIILFIIACFLVINGIIFSKPKMLFEEYRINLDIAEKYKDKSFVYVYDNSFNHMQSIPEMMIYNKSMIIDINRGEEKYFIENKQLNQEESYILSIKTYIDNDRIIQNIKDNTEFKNIELLYQEGNSNEVVIGNNLYLCSKQR